MPDEGDELFVGYVLETEEFYFLEGEEGCYGEMELLHVVVRFEQGVLFTESVRV